MDLSIAFKRQIIYLMLELLSMIKDNVNVTELAMGTAFKLKIQKWVELIHVKNVVYFVFMKSFGRCAAWTLKVLQE